ncbi:MAG: hypothetical protein V2B19_16380 [Pseudomonadota bacterium]
MGKKNRPAINELPITTLVLQNIDSAERLQHKKRYFAMATAINNAISEVCAQVVLIAHLIVTLMPHDRDRVAEALSIDLEFCENLGQYLERLENIGESERDAVMQWAQRKLIAPLLKEITKNTMEEPRGQLPRPEGRSL